MNLVQKNIKPISYRQSVKNYEYIKKQIREAKLKNLAKDEPIIMIEILLHDNYQKNSTLRKRNIVNKNYD